MTHKQHWAALSGALYLLFIVAAWFTNFLDPSRIGLEWTIFWLVTVAGLAYYFYFKNVIYREVIYYAQQLDYHKADLLALVPDLKPNQDVPDPDKPSFFSPFAQIPISVINQLTDHLVTAAKQHHVAPYR